jgi:hypothetical protein
LWTARSTAARAGSAWIAAPPSEWASVVRWVCLRRWANRWLPRCSVPIFAGQLPLHSEVDKKEVMLVSVNRMVQLIHLSNHMKTELKRTDTDHQF